MKSFMLGRERVDAIELKCMLVSRGVRVDKKVYKFFGKEYRVNINPLTCNCLILSDGTIVQMTDVGFHLEYLSGILSWDNLKLLRYASELKTPFSLDLVGDEAVLFFEGEVVDIVSFPPVTDFFRQKTDDGLPFLGNVVIQGVDWVAFPCLWPCEYASCGKPCQFCFSGADHEKAAASRKALPKPVSSRDVAQMVDVAVRDVGVNSVQLTGGSTFSGEMEREHILAYLRAIAERTPKTKLSGEILLYITPPKDPLVIDSYLAAGGDRIGASLEVWDEALAAEITPGKIAYTTRERHLSLLEYTAEKFGPSVAFSNFIIGIEPFESLREGATYLAERGILPTASVWMPMGRPVRGSMKTPGIEEYRRVKELFAELYSKYGLVPPSSRGLNVCIERDIYQFSQS